jgi:hypothetical protein
MVGSSRLLGAEAFSQNTLGIVAAAMPFGSERRAVAADVI